MMLRRIITNNSSCLQGRQLQAAASCSSSSLPSMSSTSCCSGNAQHQIFPFSLRRPLNSRFSSTRTTTTTSTTPTSSSNKMPHAVATSDEFYAALKEHDIVIVDFHATWCGPCKVIAPKYEAFSNTYTKAYFLKVDVDEVPEVAEKAEVRAMPTFQIYKAGVKVDEIVGADPNKLEAAIKKAVA